MPHGYMRHAPPHEFHTPKKKISYHSPEGVDLWGCQLLAHCKHVVSASLVDILSYLLFHYVYYAPLLRGGPKPVDPCVPPRAQLTVSVNRYEGRVKPSYKRSIGPGAPVGAQATEKSTAQRAVQGTPIDRSAYKKRPYQNKDTKLEPKQDKRSHRDITKTQRVLLDKIGTIVSESGTNSPVAHQNSRGR